MSFRQVAEQIGHIACRICRNEGLPVQFESSMGVPTPDSLSDREIVIGFTNVSNQ